MISPPQPVFRVEQSVLGIFIAGIAIQFPHLISIFPLSCQFTQLSINRHRHLYGIHPPPIIHLRSINHHVNIDLDILNHLRVRTDIIQFDINLSATLVVRIAGSISVTHSPFMIIGPLISVIIILFPRKTECNAISPS